MRNYKNTDPVLASLESLNKRYKNLGNSYIICNGEKINSEQLIKELKNNTEIGISFRNQVYETIISYFMKFDRF